MTVSEIQKLDIFKNNSELQDNIRKLNEAVNAASSFELAINAHVRDVQNRCQHTFNPTYSEKFDSHEECCILLSKTCTTCGYSPMKPNGMPWKVCQKCWGEMKYDRQELRGEDRASYYECTTCKHITWHT